MKQASAMIRRRVVALVLSLGVAACGGERDAGEIEVRLAKQADGTAAIEVVNVPDALVAAVAASERSREEWTEILRVSVAQGQSAMVGTYAASGRTLRFTRRCFQRAA